MLAPTFQKNYGVSKSLLTFLLSSKKHIHPEYQDLLSYYKLFYWKGSHILNEVSKGDGFIEREGTKFIVVFNIARGIILQFPDLQYQVSFRKAIPDAGIPAYVLIS